MSAESAETAPPAGGFRRRVVRSAASQMAGYVVSYGLRLVSSTVMRGLLFPAAFGTMEVVSGVVVGLGLLSDVGLQQAVVRSERGDDPRFLNTVWTLHVVRGFALWLLACLFAYPVARLSGVSEVLTLLPVMAASLVLMGLQSTAEFTLRRRIQLGRIVVMETACQVVSVVVMVLWARRDPSVWALVAGTLASAAVRLGWSFWLARALGHRHRFAWDAEVRAEIWGFGKWILASSALFYASTWTDRLLVVGLLGTTMAGIYATAMLLADAIGSAIDRVLHGLLYSVFAHAQRQGIERLRAVYYATRLRTDLLTQVSVGGLFVVGPWLVGVLFDARYAEAGWMLRVLSVRYAVMGLVTPAESCLVALGHSRYGFLQNLARALWLATAVPLGHHLAGAPGIVWAASLTGVPALALLWPKLRAVGILRPEREVLAPVFFAAGALLGWGVLAVLPEALEVRAWVKELLGR